MSSSSPAGSAGSMTYRLDRRYVLTSVGVQLIGAGVTAVLAFWLWGYLGILTVLLLLNALRLVALPPTVARTNPDGAKLGGAISTKPVQLTWTDVDDVSIERTQLVFQRVDGSSAVFALTYLGNRSTEFVHDVYDRLNTANGYRRFDPAG